MPMMNAMKTGGDQRELHDWEASRAGGAASERDGLCDPSLRLPLRVFLDVRLR